MTLSNWKVIFSQLKRNTLPLKMKLKMKKKIFGLENWHLQNLQHY